MGSYASIAAAVDLYKCRKQQSEQTDTISRMHVRCSVVNMSKSCWFAVVLAVICLPVILLSFVADAQPKKVKNDINGEIREVKKMIASERKEIKHVAKTIASNQQQLVSNEQQLDEDIKDGTKDIKDGTKDIKDELKDIKDEIKDVKDEMEEVETMLVSGNGQTNETRPTNGTVQQSKEELISALVCEYLARSSTILTQH